MKIDLSMVFVVSFFGNASKPKAFSSGVFLLEMRGNLAMG